MCLNFRSQKDRINDISFPVPSRPATVAGLSFRLRSRAARSFDPKAFELALDSRSPVGPLMSDPCEAEICNEG